MIRGYQKPDLQFESSMGEEGILLIQAYCEVCDASKEWSILPAVQERDEQGNMAPYIWTRIKNGIEESHDCLEPLRKLAANTVIPEVNHAIKVAKLACRALGEDY